MENFFLIDKDLKENKMGHNEHMQRSNNGKGLLKVILKSEKRFIPYA